MLHTKFQGNWPFGSAEEDFLRFLPYMGMAAILVMWPGPFEQAFVPLSQVGSIWNLALITPMGSEEKMFENADIHTYVYIRTTDAYLSTEPKGFGELKMIASQKEVFLVSSIAPHSHWVLSVMRCWCIKELQFSRRRVWCICPSLVPE